MRVLCSSPAGMLGAGHALNSLILHKLSPETQGTKMEISLHAIGQQRHLYSLYPLAEYRSITQMCDINVNITKNAHV